MGRDVRLNYEELRPIVKRFRDEGEDIIQVHVKLRDRVRDLHKDWIGEGADKFFKEMENDVLPALSRLANALFYAQDVLQKIIKIIQSFDEDTIRFFKGDLTHISPAAIGGLAAGIGVGVGAGVGGMVGGSLSGGLSGAEVAGGPQGSLGSMGGGGGPGPAGSGDQSQGAGVGAGSAGGGGANYASQAATSGPNSTPAPPAPPHSDTGIPDHVYGGSSAGASAGSGGGSSAGGGGTGAGAVGKSDGGGGTGVSAGGGAVEASAAGVAGSAALGGAGKAVKGKLRRKKK